MKKDYVKIRFTLFLILVIAVIAVCAFAPLLVPYDPYQQNLSESLQPPNFSHPLGTDRYGRDMFSRVIMGGRATVFSALALVVIIAVIGTVVGMLCGYCGGKIDSFIMRISDIFLAFPGMVLAIAAAGILGGGISSAVAALAVISWPKYARLVRAEVMNLKKRRFIEAAKMSGCGPLQIVLRHILPNILGMIFVTAALDIGTMMMQLAGLSFLGLGAMPPAAEWGSMMSNGRSMLQTSSWVVLAPGAAIFITVASFNLLGDSIRERMDPKGRLNAAGFAAKNTGKKKG